MVPPLLQRRRLLIVEDDALVRDTMILMLEEAYEVLLAASVCTALAVLRAADRPGIDAILLDCLLPGGKLADVLAETDRQSIPVVLVSGDLRLEDTVGANRRFLRKPFSQATLLGALDSTRR
jgi:DNA-binding NtrC family response regulator